MVYWCNTKIRSQYGSLRFRQRNRKCSSQTTRLGPKASSKLYVPDFETKFLLRVNSRARFSILGSSSYRETTRGQSHPGFLSTLQLRFSSPLRRHNILTIKQHFPCARTTQKPSLIKRPHPSINNSAPIQLPKTPVPQTIDLERTSNARSSQTQ